MIEITVRIGVGDYDAAEALEKLCDAIGYLNIPMEVTDTWKKDGQPIPTHIVYRAKLMYMKKHGIPPQGITLKSEYPGFQENIDALTQVCKTDRFSLVRGRPVETPRYIGPRFTKESVAEEYRVPTECHEPPVERYQKSS